MRNMTVNNDIVTGYQEYREKTGKSANTINGQCQLELHKSRRYHLIVFLQKHI